MNKEILLKIKNLSFSFNLTKIIDDISFEIKKGDFVALVGPNGAGKTTLVRIILGLLKNYKGEIKLFDQEVKNFNLWNKIGYLPQRVNNFNQLFPANVSEIVELGLLSLKKYPKRITHKDRLKIEETLSFLGIWDLKNKAISELSGGQQQRVFLARALVAEPEFLILDEPSTALDNESRDSFLKLIEKLNKEYKTTIIIITHDPGEVGQYANKLLFLDKKIIFFGDFADFCNSLDMEKYFGHFDHHLICHQH